MTPEFDLSTVTPESLAEVLQMPDGAARLWSHQELAAVFRHQLSAAIEYDLRALPTGTARAAKFVASAHGLLLKSFADLFSHPHPPLELLTLTKDFAKAHRNWPDSPLPPEISTLLYYASIAAALLHCGQFITSLDKANVRDSFTWAAQRDWIDETTRDLFTRALARLGEGGQP